MTFLVKIATRVELVAVGPIRLRVVIEFPRVHDDHYTLGEKISLINVVFTADMRA